MGGLLLLVVPIVYVVGAAASWWWAVPALLIGVLFWKMLVNVVVETIYSPIHRDLLVETCKWLLAALLFPAFGLGGMLWYFLGTPLGMVYGIAPFALVLFVIYYVMRVRFNAEVGFSTFIMNTLEQVEKGTR